MGPSAPFWLVRGTVGFRPPPLKTVMYIIYVKDGHGCAYPYPTNKYDRTTLLVSDKLRMDKANIRRYTLYIPINNCNQSYYKYNSLHLINVR